MHSARQLTAAASQLPCSSEQQPAELLWTLTVAPLTDAPLFKRHTQTSEQMEEVQRVSCTVRHCQSERIRSAT
jgi:hypothetical protein